MDEAMQIRLRSVIAKQLSVSPGVVNSDFKMGDHPAWDSMGHMGMVAEIEKVFSVRFPSHALARITSVSLIEKELSKLLGKN